MQEQDYRERRRQEVAETMRRIDQAREQWAAVAEPQPRHGGAKADLLLAVRSMWPLWAVIAAWYAVVSAFAPFGWWEGSAAGWALTAAAAAFAAWAFLTRRKGRR